MRYLLLTIFFLSSTNLIGVTLNESPILKQMSKDGKIPNVNERVPSDPLIDNPRIPWTKMKCGQYGGTLRLIDYDAGTVGHDAGWANNEQWMETAGLSHDAGSMTGGIFKDIKVTNNERTFTFHMRKGMKFSNGAAFDSEDIAFWWNDVINHPKLTPGVPQKFKAGHKPSGNPPNFKVLNKYSFVFNFDQPFGGWTGLMTYGAGLGRITDSDYLKKIHVKYANKKALDKLVKERGFEKGEWHRLWGYYQNANKQHETGLPTYGPWMLTAMWATGAKMERNPYYWKIDTCGNQLPYIDNVDIKIVQNVDAAAVEIISGNIDLARRPVNPQNIPLYMQYADKKGYKVSIQDQHASLGEVFLNITYGDSVRRKILGNKEFRRALSMAINRAEIIDAVYFGIAEEPQAIKTPSYNPEKAKSILDKIGLKKMDSKGCRLRSDGKPFKMPFEMASFTGEEIPIGEMVSKYWNAIGICTTIKQLETNLFLTKAGANEIPAMTWWAHYPRWPFHESGDYVGIAWQQTYAPLWYRWYDWNKGGGKERSNNPNEKDPLVVGIKPPAAYLTLRDKQNGLFATSNPAKQKKLWDEMRQIISENAFWIPIVDPVKGPLIVNSNLGNVASDGYAIENASSAEWFYYK